MHSITAKLNKSARTHVSEKGTTFFVNLGEKNYNYRTKETVWTNYDAALFAKDAQIKYYEDILVEGAIVSVSCKGLIVQSDEQYGPKLIMNDAWLEFGMNEHKTAVAHARGVASTSQQFQQPQDSGNQGGMDTFEDDIPF